MAPQIFICRDWFVSAVPPLLTSNNPLVTTCTARAEVGQAGESVSDKRVWKDVWMLNPHSTSDVPVKNVVYVGGAPWVPWKPTMEDLMHRGGEWSILGDRVEELVDRSYGARFAVLEELGLSLLKATETTWADGNKHYGQTQRRSFPHWNEAMEEERAKERGSREPGGAWELRSEVPGRDATGQIGTKQQQPDSWHAAWPPAAGPIPPAPDPPGRPDLRRERKPPLVSSSGEGDQDRLYGHGQLSMASGASYEGFCSESRRAVEYADGVYCGEVAASGREDATREDGGWDGGGVIRQGHGSFASLGDTVRLNPKTNGIERVATVSEGYWAGDRETEDPGIGGRPKLPKGRVEYSNGSLYHGEFLAGAGNGALLRHGVGRQVALDGTIHMGRWEYDRLVERDDQTPVAAVVSGSWVSGGFGQGTALEDEDSIGRATRSFKKPVWSMPAPSLMGKSPGQSTAEPPKGWNVMLGGDDSEQSSIEGNDVSKGSDDSAYADRAKYGKYWYLAGDDSGVLDEAEDDDEAFTSLVSMLGGAGSRRALEVLSLAAGYHAPAERDHAAASGEGALLERLALGIPAAEEVEAAAVAAAVSVEG